MKLKRFMVLTGLVGLALLIFCVIPVAADSARPAPLAQGISDETCLLCHEVPDMTLELPSGELVWLSIDRETFYDSVHGEAGYACVQCHTDITGYPHPPLTATNRREYVMQRYTSCLRCHHDKYDATLDSDHQRALAGGNQEAAVCTDCHGVHNIAHLGEEPRSRTPHMCERCHSQIFNLYEQSAHGAALMAGENPDVPTCTDCHGIHIIEGPSDTGFHLFSPNICERCHADPELMGRYDISTDIFETYVADFHGTTVELFEEMAPDQETNKPVCIDCHGVHDMRSHDDRESQVIKENLLKTCQKCHPDATANFPDSWLSHYQPTQENAPLVYYVNLFYKILVPAVIGAMVMFNLTDVRRRIFQRRKEHHHE
ncbi:MAG: cytochrome C [Chloroflexi bacterium]|nr:cytochrome C [Chloroflexota bacterium]